MGLTCTFSVLVALLAVASASQHSLGRRLKLANDGTKDFPYQACNASTPATPWRARLSYQENIKGNTVVTIKLWAEFSKTYINLSKLDLQLESKQVLANYRDGFLDARIAYGSTSYSYTKIIWNKNRPMVRFTDLAMHYSVGYNGGGYTLTFTMLYGSMSDLCDGACKYAAINGDRCTMGSLGTVPVIITEGPDFVQNISPRDLALPGQ